ATVHLAEECRHVGDRRCQLGIDERQGGRVERVLEHEEAVAVERLGLRWRHSRERADVVHPREAHVPGVGRAHALRRAEPTTATWPVVMFSTMIVASFPFGSSSTSASTVASSTTIATNRTSISPCSRNSSPHSSRSAWYAGPSTCMPCAT